jgi:hypothetical protein
MSNFMQIRDILTSYQDHAAIRSVSESRIMLYQGENTDGKDVALLVKELGLSEKTLSRLQLTSPDGSPL